MGGVQAASRRILAVLGSYTLVASATTTARATATLFAWISGAYGLTTFVPGRTFMNPTSAVATAFAAVALGLLRSPVEATGRRWIGRGCAALVVAIGALCAGGELPGWSSNVDQILFAEQIATVAPARMSFEATAGLLLIGSALLAIDARPRRGVRPGELLAVAAGTIGLFGITGYAFLGEPVTIFEESSTFAPNAALAIELLACGILAARPTSGLMSIVSRRSAGGTFLRLFVPSAVIAVWMVTGLAVQGAQAELYSDDVGVTISTVGILVLLAAAGVRAAVAHDHLDARRRRAEAALDHHETQLRAILDNAPAAIYVKDPDGRYIFANRGFCSLFPGKNPVGKTDLHLVPPYYAGQYQAADRDVLIRGEALQFEEQAPLDDRMHTYVSVKFPLYDVDGTARAVCGISTDITERKRSEDAAARLRERITVINRVLGVLATSNDQAMYADVLSVLLDAFESEEGFVGYLDEAAALVCPSPTRGAWKLRSDGALVITHRERCLLLDRVILEQRSALENAPYLAAHAVRPLHRVLAAPILHQGMTLGMILLADRAGDYTDENRTYLEELAGTIGPALAARLEHAREERQRRRAEEELRALAGRLQKANEGLESFSYSVSHDLRAPLRAIGGFARILATEHAGSLDAEGHRLLDVVSDNARRMTRLIDDLLSFSRIDRREIVRGRVDLTDIARTVVSEMRAANEDHDVEVVIDDLPLVVGDASLLRQVMTNLIDNAWKFTRGRTAPRIEIEGRVEGGQSVCVIRDNGAGFDMRYADKLFGVFSRLHATEEFEGTGVGLALVRRLVERHGGRVWAEGQVAIGATFSFALPVCGEIDERAGGDVARGG